MMKHSQLLAPLALLLSLAACASDSPDQKAMTSTADNPFFSASPLPMHYPPFDQIADSDFGPAFDLGMKEQLAEIAAIAANPEAANFGNTIVAMERSGQVLGRAQAVFGNLTSADTNDARQKLEVEYSPQFSAHEDAIWLNAELFARVQKLYQDRAKLALNAESQRLIERYHSKFVRSGANLTESQKSKLRAMNTELATLSTQFSQNVLAEVNDSAVLVSDPAELRGLSAAQIEAAAEAAEARGAAGKWLISLLNTTGQPVATSIESRSLRRRLHEASASRGSRGNAFDNREILARVARIRAERAQLLGFANHAAYVVADGTAKTPEAVNQRLSQLTPAAFKNARREAADIQALVAKEAAGAQAEPWDWNYYAEKVRKEKYDFDEAQLMPYLEFERVLRDGVFFAAEKLYGIRFRQRSDLPVYHPDVRVYDVVEADGSALAIFLLDPYARETKRGGAWMNSYVSQSRLMHDFSVVANHMNITEPSEGQPTLMTWDEVITLFHEFGHALHGMFSEVEYPYFSGTRVPRDFVEYPSQVNEMWASWPEVLKNYAKHYETGEPIPADLVQKVLDAGKFNQGFMTAEYLAASIIDQSLHQLSPDAVPSASDMMQFEAKALKDHGAYYDLVPPRYRLPYFSHIMGGYSAGYYAYVWSEVMDADSVLWFKELGGLSRENGATFRRCILSPGGSIDAMQTFRNLRGREPNIEPLLERRGLQTN